MNSEFELFDEVTLRPEYFPWAIISDREPYCVLKKYMVDLGGRKVPYADIARHKQPDEISLRGVEVNPRWNRPFILSLPCESIRHHVNNDDEHTS